MEPVPRAGSVAWCDLTVPDADDLAAFYAAVLGVEADPVPMDGYADYNLVPAGGGPPLAGVCHARGPNERLPAAWLPYFVVADLDAALGACRRRGGSVATGPSAGSAGRSAVVTDPAGASAVLVEAAPQAAAPAALRAPDPALLRHAAFAALLVASGGEGEIEAAELRTLEGRLAARFPWTDSDAVREAVAYALVHLGRVTVAEGSGEVTALGEVLDPESRGLLFDDLTAVALADGGLHRMEATLLRHIADAWGVAPALDLPATPSEPRPTPDRRHG